MKSIIFAVIISGLSMIGVVKAFTLEAASVEPAQLTCNTEICVNGMGYVVGKYDDLKGRYAGAIEMVDGDL